VKRARILAVVVLASACAPPPAVPATPPEAPAKAPEVDICAASPPVPHELAGVLRNARCEQDMYATMAAVAGDLGVKCAHCHVPIPGQADKEDYPVPTPKKAIANWMSVHLMQAVKPADGSEIHCSSCHTDGAGRPVAKILGEPRDPAKAAEWMSLVLVRKFVAADGSKLRCKSCHAGTPGTAAFKPKVILQSEQIPAHAAGGKGAPSF
jgi:hypothetical protein